MTGMKQIIISHVCYLDRRKPKVILFDEHLSQVCSRDGGKSKSNIDDGSSTDENESESVHKSINTNKERYVINETDHR